MVEVSSAGPDLPAALSVTILLVGTTTAIGFAVYASTSKFGLASSVRARFAAIWGILAFLAVAANVGLSFYPPDWLYRVETIQTVGRVSMTSIHAYNPRLVNLAITLPLTGFVGGVGSAILLRASRSKASGVVVGWLVAFGVATLVWWFGGYLIKGGMIDAFESIGLSAPLGKLAGVFATGFLTGYVTAAIGLVATAKVLQAEH